MTPILYPVYRPSLSGNEMKYVQDCIQSTWISSKGKYIQAFEESFAQYVGISYAASVSNGTVALHAALLALNIKPEDEVIVPTFTYIASVNAIRYCGAEPVFVDSLDSTWQMNPSSVRHSITSKTKAILVVHLYGHPCKMDEIMEIATEFNLLVVEDCAEALGAKFSMEVSDEAREYLVEKGYDPKFGARPLNRAIQKYLEDKIAEELLKSDLQTNDKFTVDVDKELDELKIHIVSSSDDSKIPKISKEPEN